MTRADRELSSVHWPATLLGVSGVLLAIIFILESAPWTAAYGLGEARAVPWASTLYVLTAAAGPLLLIGTLALVERTRFKQAQFAQEGTQPLQPSPDSSVGGYADRWVGLKGALRSVDFRVRGNPALAKNMTGPIWTSPVMTRVTPFWRRGRYVVVLPAAACARLSRDMGAFRAVLLHELAHVSHRDIELLALVRNVLIVTAVWTMLLALMSSCVSALVDHATGNIPLSAAFAAAVVGKTALWLTPFLTLAWLLALPILRARREATADRIAGQLVGSLALDCATQLLIGGSEPAEIEQIRPSATEVKKTGSIDLRLAATLGFAACAAASMASGHFAVLGLGTTRPNAGSVAWALVANLVYLGLLGYGTLATLSVARIRESDSSGLSVWTIAIAFLLGSCVGALVVRALPLVIPAILMPAGFDVPKRHDPGPLFLATIASSLGTGAALALIGILSVGSGNSAQRPWIIVLPLACWLALASLESVAFPSIAGGWIAIGLTALVCGVVVTIQGTPPISARSAIPASLVIVAASFSWAGYADVNHRAASAARAADLAIAHEEQATAEQWLRRSAARAPWHAEPWLRLARFAASQKQYVLAAMYADHAAAVPYLSSWEDRFLAYAESGGFRLEAHDSPEVARERLSAAIMMYREDSRFDKALAAEVLYNFAGLEADNPPSAAANLLEALVLEPSLRTSLCEDVDFSFLNLRKSAAISEKAWRVIVLDGVYDATAPAILHRGAQAGLSAADYIAVLARIADCRT